MSKLDAAIRWIRQGLNQQTKEEKRLVRESPSPLVVPTDDEEYRLAIRILEAAAKVDKRLTLNWLDEECMNCNCGPRDNRVCKDEENTDGCPLIVKSIEALLAALPDEKEKP